MKEIFNFLDREDLYFGTSLINIPLHLPFKFKPEDFIKFAEEDLRENSAKSIINALSNIKRAIDCRIESILLFCGFYEKARKEDWSFPKKKDFLLKIGVVAPTILNKINQKRNILEHEFKKPKRSDVEDFLDVANLFLLYTNLIVKKTYGTHFEWETEDRSEPFIRIEFNSKKGVFEINFVKHPKNTKKTKITIDDEENYIRVLKILIKSILNR